MLKYFWFNNQVCNLFSTENYWMLLFDSCLLNTVVVVFSDRCSRHSDTKIFKFCHNLGLHHYLLTWQISSCRGLINFREEF